MRKSRRHGQSPAEHVVVIGEVIPGRRGGET